MGVRARATLGGFGAHVRCLALEPAHDMQAPNWRGLTAMRGALGQLGSVAVRLAPPVHSSTVPVMKLAPAR